MCSRKEELKDKPKSRVIKIKIVQEYRRKLVIHNPFKAKLPSAKDNKTQESITKILSVIKTQIKIEKIEKMTVRKTG